MMRCRKKARGTTYEQGGEKVREEKSPDHRKNRGGYPAVRQWHKGEKWKKGAMEKKVGELEEDNLPPKRKQGQVGPFVVFALDKAPPTPNLCRKRNEAGVVRNGGWGGNSHFNTKRIKKKTRKEGGGNGGGEMSTTTKLESMVWQIGKTVKQLKSGKKQNTVTVGKKRGQKKEKEGRERGKQGVPTTN